MHTGQALLPRITFMRNWLLPQCDRCPSGVRLEDARKLIAFHWGQLVNSAMLLKRKENLTAAPMSLGKVAASLYFKCSCKDSALNTSIRIRSSSVMTHCSPRFRRALNCRTFAPRFQTKLMWSTHRLRTVPGSFLWWLGFATKLQSSLTVIASLKQAWPNSTLKSSLKSIPARRETPSRKTVKTSQKNKLAKIQTLRLT